VVIRVTLAACRGRFDCRRDSRQNTDEGVTTMAEQASASAEMTGGCLCGAIRYRVAQHPDKIIMCHCTDCQKASGAGASANTVVPTDSFEITIGTPKVFSKVVDSGNTLMRAFCPDCGSPIYSRRANAPQMTVLKVGSLDAPVDLKVVMNIWTRSARPWMHIDPALDQYPQNRPAPSKS
jgi:hypothetical protein